MSHSFNFSTFVTSHVLCRAFGIHTTSLPIDFKGSAGGGPDFSAYYETRCKCCRRLMRRLVLDKTPRRWKLVSKLADSHPLSDHMLELARIRDATSVTVAASAGAAANTAPAMPMTSTIRPSAVNSPDQPRYHERA